MSDPTRPFHNPFGALAHLRGDAPPAEDTSSEPAPAPAPARGQTIARAVIRMERSGRGGKEVTVVEHLALPAGELEKWLRALKSSLGCGGTVEGDAIVLQGDHRKRLPALLTARGVRKITV
jgi:translation initiation factor 1